MADHQVPRIGFTFDADSCTVEFALFFASTISTRWLRHMRLKGSLGIRVSPVSAAGFPQDSDMFLVLVSHLQPETGIKIDGPPEPGYVTLATLSPHFLASNMKVSV